MAGMVSSLNVSVAGAVVMYEAMRQRRKAPEPVRKRVKEQRGLGS
jgi:23S rRNA (guanosine2251-2'-O)-methyltransferase